MFRKGILTNLKNGPLWPKILYPRGFQNFIRVIFEKMGHYGPKLFSTPGGCKIYKKMYENVPGVHFTNLKKWAIMAQNYL